MAGRPAPVHDRSCTPGPRGGSTALLLHISPFSPKCDSRHKRNKTLSEYQCQLPSQISVGASPRARAASGIFSGLPWAALCWCRCCCGVGVVVGVDAVGVGVWRVVSVPSGVRVVVADVASCGTGNQISRNIRGLHDHAAPPLQPDSPATTTR